MICRECPIRVNCPERSITQNCCIGDWSHSWCDGTSCRVQHECEAITEAGEAVAILEEFE